MQAQGLAVLKANIKTLDHFCQQKYTIKTRPVISKRKTRISLYFYIFVNTYYRNEIDLIGSWNIFMSNSCWCYYTKV
jgi:hypothetical protein